MNHMLTLAEIAAWQITARPARTGPIVAALPAMQRGAVWKVRQIEELWDSILRQFPLGAFIVSPFDEKRGSQKARHQQAGLPPATHHLLDGQQRATGIALGFADVWRPRADAGQVRATCWIDLAAAPEQRDVEFVLRVQTQAHPWGYARANPDTRLAQNRIRAAIKAFQAVNPGYHEARPEAIPLTLTWPWDSVAPVPLPILLDALAACEGDVEAAIQSAWRRVSALPMFQDASRLDEPAHHPSDDPALAMAREQLEACRAALESAFTDEGSALAARLRRLMARLVDVVSADSSYRIPVLHLELGDWNAYGARTGAKAEAQPEPGDKLDPVELLFVRINSAGTPLAGEELVYSLLKSAWIDAPRFIETLAHRPAGPARIAALCIRLVQGRLQRSAWDGAPARRLAMPGTPGVDEFRRLMRSAGQSSFQSALEGYIKEEAATTFARAWRFLTGEGGAAVPFALPRVVAAELAQKTPDVFFVLLAWLDRLAALGASADQQSTSQYKRTLGFLTAVSWFAIDKSKAMGTLWHQLQAESDPARLLDFFNRRQFGHLCRLDDQLQSRMIPLIGADELELVCKKRIMGHQGCQDTISRQDSEIWKHWDWNGWLVTPAAIELNAFYLEKLYPETIANDREIDVPESARIACHHFFEVLWGCHPMLLFAQRKWIATWFPAFDPALPEFMEDRNRPWDYDHIHPQSYLRSEGGHSLRGMPQLIKDWHSSIGNLRVWPLEINRADGDSTPQSKFRELRPVERRYGLRRWQDKLEASCVDEEGLARWERSLPAHADKWYLKETGNHEERRALVMAMVGRFVALYRGWYETLRIKDLQ